MPKITYYRRELSKFMSAKEVGELIKSIKEKVKKQKRTAPKYYQDKHVRRILYNILENYKSRNLF